MQNRAKPFATGWPHYLRVTTAFIGALLGSQVRCQDVPTPAPHFANGLKIGEITTSHALIWTRLTANPERNTDGPEFAVEKRPSRWTEPIDLATYRHAVPGMAGEIEITLHAEDHPDRAQTLGPVTVTADTDFAHVFEADGLTPDTVYEVSVIGRRDHATSAPLTTRFRTAPPKDSTRPIRFTAITCQDFPRRDDRELGHRIYPSMGALTPDFFVHLGDVLYYDKPGPFATNVALARHKWNRLYALPHQRAFHRTVPSYFAKDDHDILRDDAWPGQHYFDLTWEDGLRLFREQTPCPREDERPYRTIRWGRDLQIWILEIREFRTPNNLEDLAKKSILGEMQFAWLRETMATSDATFRVVLSPTPIVGPDRTRKNDNHANAGFAHEGRIVREFLASQGALVLCGDRHWQFRSTDPETGLVEIGCGATSDAHAGGYPRSPSFLPDFLRVKGGFVSVEVSRESGEPRLVARHHDVEGEVVHEFVVTDR